MMAINTIGDLKHDQRNPRKHNPRNLKVIVDSLHDVGFARSIVIDEDNNILAGNGVTEAAAIAGIERVIEVEADGNTIIAVRRRGLSDEQKQRLKYLDNRSGELAEWDAEQLLADIGAGLDLSSMFRDDELDALLADLQPKPEVNDAGANIDRAEELRVKWQVEAGQMWQLGEHRLICGDCTDAAVVARLMGGERAAMVFTDPPYGVDYEGGLNGRKRTKIEGDTTGDLYMPALKSLKSICADGAPMYVWFADRGGKPVYDAVDAIGYTVRAMIVWNKLKAHYGNFMAQYMQKHEPCLYIVDGNASWIGPTNEVTVWDVDQPSVNELHPTQKPVELAARAIGNHKADIVADFFLGSGSTLIACEQLNRKCRAIEISPGYVAVALDRWATATSKTPVLVTG